MGFPAGVTGAELASRAQNQAQKFGANLVVSQNVVLLDCEQHPFALYLSGGSCIHSRTVVIATGSSYRRLSEPNGTQVPDGIHYSATAIEAQVCKDEVVVIVGGGNSAGQAAMFLSKSAKHVHMVIRKPELSNTMSDYLAARISQPKKITLHRSKEVCAVHGEPLVLLHGWPQTWFCWHRLMPALDQHFTVIAIDLRGAGQSSRPESPAAYDSVTMANDVRELMTQLGFESIRIAGHDVGLLVVFAYAALYPQSVSHLVVLDGLLVGIEPMTTGFLGDPRSWLFGFVQTSDLPETLVLGREREFLGWVFAAIVFNSQAISSKELDTYIEAYSQPGAMQASFEWFRAFEAVSAFNESYTTKKLTVPVLALGGDKMMGGFMVPMMQSVAENVCGGAISVSGHWVIEEQPGTLLRELLSFLP